MHLLILFPFTIIIILFELNQNYFHLIECRRHKQVDFSLFNWKNMGLINADVILKIE
jgi:hypothetical protein